MLTQKRRTSLHKPEIDNCGKYYYTIQSHNLILTAFLKRDLSFQQWHNLKIFMLMVKLHILGYTCTP